MYFRHKKTGGIYSLTALVTNEADLAPTALYQCTETGMMWTRPASEFFDGRFETYIMPKPTPAGPDGRPLQ